MIRAARQFISDPSLDDDLRTGGSGSRTRKDIPDDSQNVPKRTATPAPLPIPDPPPINRNRNVEMELNKRAPAAKSKDMQITKTDDDVKESKKVGVATKAQKWIEAHPVETGGILILLVLIYRRFL
jgi:hypothetical protein